MINSERLLEITKIIVSETANKVISHGQVHALKNHSYDNYLQREVKAAADKFIEKQLISELEKEGIPILSEECGLKGDIKKEPNYIFIVDPLDGTFNFIKDFGSCGISVALWHKEQPIFGVIYDFNRREIFWGGKEFGAFCGKSKLETSTISDIKKSLVCSGFPVRYDLKAMYQDNYLTTLSKFAKVRMIGSAAISIINVARGAAEAYFEKNIMIWDVAAGIAIAEGAGADFTLKPTSIPQSFDVVVSNSNILNELKGILNEH